MDTPMDKLLDKATQIPMSNQCFVQLLDLIKKMKKEEEIVIINSYNNSQERCVNQGNLMLKALGKTEVFEYNPKEGKQYYNDTFK